MHEPLEIADRLAQSARRAAPPEFVVRSTRGRIARQVLHRLEMKSYRDGLEAPMLLFTAGYMATALVAAVFGVSLLTTMNDPLSPLFQIATVVAQ